MRYLISILFTLLSGHTWAVDCISSNITLSTQAEVDSFQIDYGPCDRVLGSLTISGSDISDIDALSGLAGVNGRLTVKNNDNLTDLDGLSNLNSLGGGLDVISNNALRNIDGLVSINSVGGTLDISGNDALTDINGLSNVASISGGLFVGNPGTGGGNLLLTHIDALSNLSSIGMGRIGVAFSIGLHIGSNDLLENIDGLSSLAGSIEGEIYIGNNSVLANINGLDNITSVGGVKIVGNNNLTNVDGLTGIKFVELAPNPFGINLEIVSNPMLSNIDGLSQISYIEGDIEVASNTILSGCSAMGVILGWPNGPPDDNVDGTIDISLNTAGCNSIEEVLSSVSGPSAPSITSFEAANEQITLAFSPATTPDTLWPVTGYLGSCLTDGGNIFQNENSVAIPDEGSVDSPLTVSETSSQSSDGLSIAVNITHTRPRHLTLTLTSHAGTSVMLWDMATGDDEDIIGTFPTTLEPTESLSAFDNEDFNGEWTLTVADSVASQTGTLNSWGIIVQDKTTATSPNSPVTLTGLTNGFQYSCTVSAVTALGIGPVFNIISATPNPTIPDTPVITGTEPEDGAILVRFTTSSDGGSPISSYTVTCGTESATGTNSPITVTNLANDTAYSCTVIATNPVGSSPASEPSSPATPEEQIYRLNIPLLKAALDAQEAN